MCFFPTEELSLFYIEDARFGVVNVRWDSLTGSLGRQIRPENIKYRFRLLNVT